MVKQGVVSHAAAEYLKDGDWHPAEDVINAIRRVIPFSEAIRRARKDRLSGTTTSEQTQVHIGQTLIAKRGLSALLLSGRLEQAARGDVLHIRDTMALHKTVTAVAVELGRSPSTLHNWVVDADSLEWVRKRCPDGIEPVSRIRGYAMIHNDAVSAWRELSDKRTAPRTAEPGRILDIVEEVFQLSPREALAKLAEFRRKLWEIDYSILRRQIEPNKSTKKSPPTGSDAGASSQQGAND